MLNKAKQYATAAHSGQYRKYTGEPYLAHPLDVAVILMGVIDDVEVVAAGVLHDVTEDCGVTAQDLLDEGFTPQVVKYVVGMTDVSVPEDGNREVRKKLDRNNLAVACDNTKTIKLADLISNSRSIIQYDKKFAKTYIKEMKQLLEVLEGGDDVLYKVCENIVKEYYEQDCSN